MNQTVIGIDPGLSGAIAVITPEAYAVHDMPTLAIEAGKKRSKTTGKMTTVIRNKYNIAEIRRLLTMVRDVSHVRGYPVQLWLEKSQAMPDQGGVSNFNYGVGFGILQTCAICLDIPLNPVAPVAWKKVVMAGQGKEKDAAVYRAQQLFPNAVLVTQRGKLLDGRAEALLIAHYGKTFNA